MSGGVLDPNVKYKMFQSESGDWFAIPESQYEDDVSKYNEGLGDEEIMLNFEEGNTGWVYVADPSKLIFAVTEDK